MLGTQGLSPDGTPTWFLARHNQQGAEEWRRVEELDRGAYFWRQGHLAIAPEDHLFAVITQSLEDYRIQLSKFDLQGQKLWQTNYATPGRSKLARTIAVNDNGDLFIAGRDYGGSSASNFVAKFDGAGHLLWSSFFPLGAFTGTEMGVAATAAGGVFFAGVHGLTYLASAGIVGWHRNGIFSDVVLAATGDVHVTGIKTESYSPSGQLIWSVPVSGFEILANDSSIFVVQPSRVSKFSLHGEELWSSSFSLDAVALGPDAAVYSTVHWGGASATRMLSPEGTEHWMARDLGGATLFGLGSSIVVCPNNDVVTAHIVSEDSVTNYYQLTRHQRLPASDAPTIALTPRRVTAVPGTTVCFQAQVTGPGPYSLQWYRSSFFFGISRGQLLEETDPILCLPAEVDTEGGYSLAVIGPSGVYVSADVRFDLQRPYIYPLIPITNDLWRVRFLRADFTSFWLEVSTNLVDWAPVKQVPTLAPGSFETTIPRSSTGFQFFRVRQD